MSTQFFAKGDRVEVTRTVARVVTFDLGTVVDIPYEDGVRVELDGSKGRALVYDAGDVRSIPDAVDRHITRLLRALGAVTGEEYDAVAATLLLRMGVDADCGVIEHARAIAARVEGLIV